MKYKLSKISVEDAVRYLNENDRFNEYKISCSRIKRSSVQIIQGVRLVNEYFETITKTGALRDFSEIYGENLEDVLDEIIWENENLQCFT